jgi:hypothetical protein
MLPVPDKLFKRIREITEEGKGGLQCGWKMNGCRIRRFSAEVNVILVVNSNVSIVCACAYVCM